MNYFDAVYNLECITNNVVIYTSGQKIFLPEAKFLMDKTILHLEAQTAPGKTIATLANFTLTLVDKKDNFILEDYPLLNLRQMSPLNRKRWLQIKNLNTAKSYFKFFVVGTLPPGRAIQISFYYNNK